MPKYNNFHIPIIENEPQGYDALSQGISKTTSTLGAALMQRRQAEIDMANQIELARQKALIEGQVKNQLANESFNQNINRLKQNPELFGLPSSPEINTTGGSMSNIAPPAFRTLVNPMTGQIHQVVNPEYSLYRSQELAKMRNEMQPESVDASNAIEYARVAKASLDKIKPIVNKKDFDWGAFGAWRVGQDSASFTTFGRNIKNPKTKEMLDIHNSLQFIKKSAFGEAGKALTEGEKDLVFSVLKPEGQDIESWKNNLILAHEILINKANLLARNKGNIDRAIASTNIDQDMDKQINAMLDQMGAE